MVEQILTSKGCLLLAALSPLAVFAAESSAVNPPTDSHAVSAAPAVDAFATVGEHVISVAQFAAALREGLRKKYYHGKVPDGVEATFRQEVAHELIDRTLQLGEARRLGFEPDRARVEEKLAVIEKRASQHPQWPAHREQMLPRMRAQLEQDSLAERLQQQVRTVPAATETVLRAFYDANPQRFIEPERFRISAILLKVAPSSPAAAWKGASAEAEALVRKLRAGASFAELARLHSGDGSAERGGDMGYLHRGMLGDPAQKAVDAAQVGEITDPVKLLEGIGIFRLDDRPVPQLTPFEQARERVAALWLREQSERAWQAFMDRLRNSVVIQIYEPRHLQSSRHEAAKM